jgi:peptidoglycan L-alanyl-D-glutamate endopeptidase CwlK
LIAQLKTLPVGLRKPYEQSTSKTRCTLKAGRNPGLLLPTPKEDSAYHNYGLAIDIAFINSGKLSYDMKADIDKDAKADWMEVVEIFRQFGWEWGGTWATIKDYPHFQKTFGHSVRDLLALYQGGKVDEHHYVLL